MKKKFFQKSGCRFLASGLAAIGAFAWIASSDNAPVRAKAEEGGIPTVASLFTAENGVEITTNVNTPSYVAEAANGVFVSSPSAGKVVYNNIIDVTDMTQDSTLFEVQITPQAIGVSEFNQLLVRLEDVEDPKSYVEISLYRYFYNDSSVDRTAHVSVKPDSVEIFNGRYYVNKVQEVPVLDENGEPVLDPETQQPVIKKQDNVSYYMREGVRQSTMVQGPFAGAKGGWSNSMKIYYNDAEKTIYTKDSSLWSPNKATGILTDFGFADEDGKVVVLDMDTASDMGINKTAIWDGFPSGKVKLSIQTNELLGEDNANYMILQIDGQKFDGEYLNDVTAPELSVDTLGYGENALPNAIVGKEYSFFPATAVDKMYGELDVKTKVYKDDKLVFSTGDGFVPETAGDYVLEFVASDGNRNEAVERFNVTAVHSANAIVGSLNVEGALDLNDAAARNISLYYPVTLPTMETSGGSGMIEVKTEVFFNGKKQAVEKGVFTPSATGDYVVRYTLTDYIGNVQTYEYLLKASYSENPRLIAPVLPDYLSIGQANLLPKVNSELYTVWKQKVETYDKIYVYKADGETLITEFDGSQEAVFIPEGNNGDTVIVVYSTAKDANSEQIVAWKEITLVSSAQLSNKFIQSEGVSMEMSEMGDAFDFIFTDDGQSVEYIGKLTIFGGLRIEFNVPAGMNAYGGVSFTVVDAYNPERFIVIDFFKNPETTARTSFVSVNGGAMGSFPASFHGNVSDYFVFTVSQNGEVYNYNEDIVAKAENFKGFESGYVYVSMSALEVEPTDEIPAVVSWVVIKNQNFNEVSEYKDMIIPTLTVFEDPVGLASLGDKISISGAVACDVYSEAVTLNVTVKFGETEILKYTDDFGRFSGATFYATNYGSYTINYEALDMKGNKATKSYTVVIRDTKAPTLKIDGEMPAVWNKGKAFEFPSATAEDNVDLSVAVYVIVINPVNVYTVLRDGDTYTPAMNGRYIVRFYCEDSRYNTTYSQDYVVIVE